jgi:cell division septum initiation protein DivIVA
MDDTGVLSLVDELTNYLEDGKTSFGNRDRRVIDIGPALDILDEIRQRFPQEVEQAQQTLREREEIIAEANAKSDHIIADAQEQAKIISGEQEIVRLANDQAANILADARQQESQMRHGSEQYADKILSYLDSQLTQFSQQVARSRERLSQPINK